MERLNEHTTPGMDAVSLRRWGFLFLAMGLIGRGVLQTHFLGFNNLTMEQMLSAMSQSQQVMTFATISLVLQAVETCAAPIFSLLLVERVHQGKADLSHLGRLLALALICELPYNLALGAGVLDLSSRNPVFALALSLVMLLFYKRYAGKGLRNTCIKLVVTLAAVMWGGMLAIDAGAPMAVITAILWLLRSRPLYRGFGGAAAAVTCTVFSPFYLASPMGFLAAHRFNGEFGQDGIKPWLIYPVMLIIVAGLGMVLL